MIVSLAHSEDIDSADAVEDVVRDSLTQLLGNTPQAGLLIASTEHDFELIQGRLLTEWPGLQLIGCSGDGEMSTLAGSVQDSVALMLFCSKNVRIRAGLGRAVSKDPSAAAKAAIQQAMQGETEAPALAVIVPEGWKIDVDILLEAFQEALGEETLLVGGMSSDSEHQGLTRQAYMAEALTDSVPCLLFFGPLKLAHAVRSGMKPVASRTHKVTSAEGPYVREIDNRPAEDLWKHYFETHSIFNPLAVFPMDDGEYFIAASPQILADGSAYFFNSVPEGSLVKPADSTNEEALEATSQSVLEAVAGFPGTRPDAAIVFSCAGRRAALGTQVHKEVDLLRAALPEGVPAIGFHSNGELCPLKGQKETQDHGFSFVTLLLGED